jgi:REP element-mobilizing transposase RayT
MIADVSTFPGDHRIARRRSEGARPARLGGETPPPRKEIPPMREHKGWYVPRALPHFDSAEVAQAITFRLADALPRAVVMARKDETFAAHRRRVAAALDAGHGGCLLRDPALAEIVEAALLHGVGAGYQLFAWVIMPNHVHALIAPMADNRLADIVHAWKSWTAKAINRRRGASGSVWQREYFDRFIRDDPHFAAAVAYIEENPVKAGLAAQPADWRFGSAWRRAP